MGATILLVADAQRLVREGLRALIAKRWRLEAICEAEDGRAAVEIATQERPHVVVINSEMPELSGLEAVRRIRASNPRCRCIVMLSTGSAAHVRQALMAGASALVAMSSGARELIDAIEAVRGGRRYLPASLGGYVAEALGTSNAVVEPGANGLTDRQRRVLQLIAEGMSTRQIAGELRISPKTAQTHRAKLMGRLGIHKVSSLVRFAVREGIVGA
jgi:DNA-binding NarL/FixJ family response regulator